MKQLQLAALVVYVICLPFFWPSLFVIPGVGKAVYLADVAFLLLLGTIAAAPRERLRPPMWTLIALAALSLSAIALSATLNHAWGDGAPELLRIAYSLVVLLLLAHVRLERWELERAAKAFRLHVEVRPSPAAEATPRTIRRMRIAEGPIGCAAYLRAEVDLPRVTPSRS